MTDKFALAKAFRETNYALSAVGWRGCSVEETQSVLDLIIKHKKNPGELAKELNTLFKYHPSTIALNKSFRRSCENFDDQICNCWLPDVSREQYPCVIRRKEFIQTTRKRNYAEYSAWRKKVYERDNYTCQKCGQVGGKLNAHHIKSYKKFPRLRLKLNNGITLCEKCHREEHRKKVDVENGKTKKTNC